jgi:hypothetical protein
MALLPKLHLNKHKLWHIIFGPEELGGLPLPNLYTIQGIDRLQLFLGRLRLRDRTGDLIHSDLTLFQLLAGIGQFFFNQDYAVCRLYMVGNQGGSRPYGNSPAKQN